MKWIIGAVALFLVGCGGNNGSANNGTPPPPFDPAPLVGTYSGNWHNVTFNTTGTAVLKVTADTVAHTMTIIVTLGGNVFGGNAPPPQTITGPYTTSGLAINQTSQVFGNMVVNIDSQGNVKGSGSNVPGGTVSSVQFKGQFLPKSMNIGYTANLVSGGSATGTLSATKP
jgi:hypothetical protein